MSGPLGDGGDREHPAPAPLLPPAPPRDLPSGSLAWRNGGESEWTYGKEPKSIQDEQDRMLGKCVRLALRELDAGAAIFYGRLRVTNEGKDGDRRVVVTHD